MQIRSSRFGPIKHFSPSEVKLASASALSSFMVRKIKCQTHLLPESRPLPPSTLQPADWASSHPRHCHLVFILDSQQQQQQQQSSHEFKALHRLLNHNTNCPGSGLNERFLVFLVFFFLFPFQSLKSPRCIRCVCEAHCA